MACKHEKIINVEINFPESISGTCAECSIGITYKGISVTGEISKLLESNNVITEKGIYIMNNTKNS